MAKISVFAPASIGNVSVGFDLLGLAVASQDRQLGDVVSVEAATENSLEVIGEYANVLSPKPQDNLVWTALEKFNAYLTKFTDTKIQKVKLTLDKSLPICSGLGSSGTSVVAACVALNEFYNQAIDELKLLELMGDCEAGASGSVHYDNIAPSFLGGLRLCDSSCSQSFSIPWPEEWSLILAYSGVDVPTAQARKALPTSYPRSIVIKQMQYLAHFIDAMHQKDLSRAAANVQDLLAEPYRSEFLPNFDEVTRTLHNKFKVLASGISGSGPTVFAIIDGTVDKIAVKEYLEREYCLHNGFVVFADCNLHGAQKI